jgi:osmoprotectant transport system substrate-binding protein
MKRNRLLILAITAVLAFSATTSAIACTGKKVVIGRTATLQQELLAQLLMVLISERTGTTVNEVVFDSPDAAHAALLKGDTDLGLEYTGVIGVSLLGQAPVLDAASLYSAVRKGYSNDHNLMVLQPPGFENRALAPAGSANQAVVILRKETWKKFPALDRLIEKLSGQIDDATMQGLEEKAAAGDVRKVASDFLRAKKLY